MNGDDEFMPRKVQLQEAKAQLQFSDSRAYAMFRRLYAVLHLDTDHPTRDCGVAAAMLTVAAMIKETEPADDL